MATWQAIVNGTTYSLSDANPFKLISATGIGNAPVRRLEERGPFQDGVTDVGYRFDPRMINLVIGVHSASRSAADTNRDTLSGIFNPTGNALIKLRCTRDDSSVRQIDCYAVGLVDMAAQLPERSIAFQRVGVQLKAPNPFWYDPTQQSATFATLAAQAWSTGNGVIGTAYIAGTVELPAVNTALGTGSFAAGEPWTVFAYTQIDQDAGEVSYLVDGSTLLITSGTANALAERRISAVVGTANVQGNAENYGTAQAQCYFLVSDGASFTLYENGTARITRTVGTVATWSVANSRWRGTAASSDWNNAVTYGAVYTKALSEAERSAIIGAVGTPPLALTLAYAGNVPEYPVITLAGPLYNPEVTNHTTGETLDFTGSTVSGSVAYTIDLRYGYKTVTDDGQANKVSQLSDDSDLATWHLEPGNNALTMTASGTTALSGVTINYYNRYIGL